MRKIASLAGFVLAAQISFAQNSAFSMHPLISDIPNPTGTPADTGVVIDPNLVNPWGIAISSSSPFWISNAGTGTAGIYSYAAPNTTANPTASPVFTVNSAATTNVPSASGGPAVVTGQIASTVFAGFKVGGTVPSFMFCTEDGTISARVAPNNTTTAAIQINNNGKAVYKGCAALMTSQGPRFYAANFSAGTVDVFDTNYKPVVTGGGFTDPNLAPGMNPFNVQAFGQKLYVTYALLGPDGVHDQAGRGNGQVDVYDWDGNLMQSISDVSMNSPWGLEIAPEFFGQFQEFAFALLVGNFGDGKINAFDTTTGAYLGTL